MADSTSSSMSAHLCLMAWNEPMGRPNCTRSLAYCTAVSSTFWAPPTCSAASATAARSSTRSSVVQPAPSVPMSVAGVPASSSLACLRVWSIVARAVRVTPVGVGVDREDATRRRRSWPPRGAGWRRGRRARTSSCRSIVQPSPAFVAVASMPLSSHLPLGSVKARVAIVSPEAMPGRCSFLAASSPAWSSVLRGEHGATRSTGRTAGRGPSPRARR